ncbi:MAG TPA: hypothetical protein VFD63_10235 [Pyrinomonadaceae bacterium]|nr:hypothetical protein [Pyrinomonadaceae bacterium]
MSSLTPPNPVVQAIIAGTAPRPARLAAARGMLPLPQTDRLEILISLQANEDEELAAAASETLGAESPEDLLIVAKGEDSPVSVLSYLAGRKEATKEIHEAVVLNPQTPDEALATLASITSEGSLLELVTVNQTRLVRFPALIEAVLNNPARTPEAERRAKETRLEFFEKERGARQIADELRARGQTAAAEFFEEAELTTDSGGLTIEDAWIIAQHIEVSDADIDDSWLPLERYEELLGETDADRAANLQRVIESERLEAGDVSTERISLIRRIMLMNTRDRMKLAVKGDREARGILIRDSNKIVSSAVINNPRITEHEVENIAAMRTVSDDVLRLIALNRGWARQYPIIHNLARNPRTPIPTAMHILPRIRSKDLQTLAQSKNVSEAVRRQAYRLCQVRTGE